MQFHLSEELGMIQDAARGFSDSRLKPNAAKWDEEARLDRPTFEAAAALGFGGIYVKEDVGGSALSRLGAALVFEQLARGCISTTAMLTIHNMAAGMIDRFGAPEQRQRWLPKLVSMEWIASYCLTEPGSGSDAAALRTRAVRDGDAYVINGAKAFISGAGFSDIYVAMVRTGDASSKGISAFVIERDTPGLSFGPPEKKMGWNAQPTATVNFTDCRISAHNLLGAEGEGFKFAMAGLDGGRINIGACSLGGAAEALDRALEYARTRTQFGKAIADFQATQFKLADMATDLDAARLLIYRAADAIDRADPSATRYSAMAKRFSTDACSEIANHALQIHGGYGYLKAYEVERIVRDLRVHQILEGTNEIMRVIISRDMLRGNS